MKSEIKRRNLRPHRLSVKEADKERLPKAPAYIHHRSRELRKNKTRAEALLWECLRSRRLKGLKFRRQHPLGRYIADFYCPEVRLAAELDGQIHTSRDQREYDKIRQEEIEAYCVNLIRIRNEELEGNLEKVLKKIRAMLKSTQ